MEMLKHYDLFSTRITHVKFPLQIELIKKILNHADEKFNDKGYISTVGGTQEHSDFDGKEELNNQLNKFFIHNFGLKIYYGWLNILDDKAYNEPHRHFTVDSSHLSGVFYLSSNNGKITFVKDDEIWEFQPSIYDLLIFPSQLVHYVLPSGVPGKRVSYAFNFEFSNNQDNRNLKEMK